MERIKAALERAQQEQQQSASGTPGHTPLDNRLEGGAITYSKTRSVKVSDRLLTERRIISGNLSSELADAYKILRTQVLQRLSENNWNALGITSPGAQEGKTLTAINLAISLAMEVNYTVLLVDADLRKPGVHECFGLPTGPGLSDYLTGKASIQDILIHPEGTGECVILPGGKPLQNSSELLNSPKMVQLVDELKNRYPSRIVIFDLPPLLTASDALAFSPYIDAALLVVEEFKTTTQDLERAVELLKGTNLIGTTLNKCRTLPSNNKNIGWFGKLFQTQA